jgi:hypothetical protein
MPSIRVRRSSYSVLDAPPGADSGRDTFPRSLANIFGSPLATQQRPAFSTFDASRLQPPVEQESSPGTPSELPRSPVVRRPRANSRVAHHVMNQKTARFGSADRGSIRSSVNVAGVPGSPRQGLVTLEGDQADVVVHSEGTPGIIGSALSLPHSAGESVRNLMEDEHHHDDIVEHLDVIGNVLSFDIWVIPMFF